MSLMKTTKIWEVNTFLDGDIIQEMERLACGHVMTYRTGKPKSLQLWDCARKKKSPTFVGMMIVAWNHGLLPKELKRLEETKSSNHVLTLITVLRRQCPKDNQSFQAMLRSIAWRPLVTEIPELAKALSAWKHPCENVITWDEERFNEWKRTLEKNTIWRDINEVNNPRPTTRSHGQKRPRSPETSITKRLKHTKKNHQNPPKQETFQTSESSSSASTSQNEAPTRIPLKRSSRDHTKLPREGNEVLYGELEKMFAAMLPMFDCIIERWTMYQVVVKAQLYHIDDKEGYAGHWHREGATENVKGVGVYYFQLDEGLTGGDIRFRPSTVMEESYAKFVREREPEYEDTVDVPVKLGHAVVFENSLPHRVRLIKNNVGDGKKRHRGILTFFIIDPDKRMETTADYGCLNRDVLSECLAPVFVDENVVDVTCSYFHGLMTLEEARALREVSINQQIQDRDHWGTICHGNCGDTIFLEQLKNPFMLIKEKDGFLHMGQVLERTYLNDE